MEPWSPKFEIFKKHEFMVFVNSNKHMWHHNHLNVPYRAHPFCNEKPMRPNTTTLHLLLT